MSDEPVELVDGIFTDIGNAVLKPPTWVIRDLLPVGLTFIGAPPKCGKSTLSMAIAALVAGYKCFVLPPFLSEVDHGGPVLAFSYEATAGELRHMLEEGLKVSITNNGGILIADDPWKFRLDDEGGMEKMLFWLRERNPRLVILDPLRDFHQLEEKDSGGMNRLLRPLRQWAVENDSAVMVVHHTKKKDEQNSGAYTAADLRGTSALFGIADAVLMLTPRPEGWAQFEATFKRAAPWQRTIRMAAYDYASLPASERTTKVDEAVLKIFHQEGTAKMEDVARRVQVGKAAIVESCQRLERNGHLKKQGKKYVAVVVEDGEENP